MENFKDELTKIKEKLAVVEQLATLGQKKVLTMSDASILTGLSRSRLYKLTCYKQIPHYKADGGKLNYFDRDELTAWQLKNKIKTADEIEKEAENYMLTGAVKKKGGKHV
ncbi:MAG: helix-turn-helix domain-containing protein [Dysgonamonadaceae bacterium]|jgi:predicted DNA-binding transcriptional regulator AlpA|nr:helix-turn-helix domain-containing protein [Dysgonamonadaceae bacterium]